MSARYSFDIFLLHYIPLPGVAGYRVLVLMSPCRGQWVQVNMFVPV